MRLLAPSQIWQYKIFVNNGNEKKKEDLVLFFSPSG